METQITETAFLKSIVVRIGWTGRSRYPAHRYQANNSSRSEYLDLSIEPKTILPITSWSYNWSVILQLAGMDGWQLYQFVSQRLLLDQVLIPDNFMKHYLGSLMYWMCYFSQKSLFINYYWSGCIIISFYILLPRNFHSVLIKLILMLICRYYRLQVIFLEKTNP